ncbi:MAG: helix-turn-helix transcriptional regulator [Clostridia bacterium]|nr:helix-turn-helix transcriptional regulator [Clostridia bacterium]
MEENKSFAEYLISLREKENLNQAELAEKINVNIEKVKLWEKGHLYPELKEMYALSGFYMVSCQYLLDFKEKEMVRDKNIIRKISKALGISMFAAGALLILTILGLFIFAWIFFKMSGDTAVQYL